MAGVAGTREGWRGGSLTEKVRGEAGNIFMMGQRHVTPR